MATVWVVATCIPDDTAPIAPSVFISKQGAEDYYCRQLVLDIGPEQLPSYGVEVKGKDFPVVIDYDRAVKLHDAFADSNGAWGQYRIFEIEVLP